MARKRERQKREQARQRSRPLPPGAARRRTAQQLAEAVAEEARRTATQLLRPGGAPAAAGDLAGALLGLALRTSAQSPLAGRHACRAGCDFCCYTAVTIAPPEILTIAAYLRAHCGAEELRVVRAQMDRNAALAASMSRAEYIAALVPCALRADDGNCRAHAVRPLACAGYSSTSREACAAEFNRVHGRVPVPTDPYGLVVGLAVSHGLKDACRQAGFEAEFYELHHALRRALDTPDAAERWARGESVFAGCPV